MMKQIHSLGFGARCVAIWILIVGKLYGSTGHDEKYIDEMLLDRMDCYIKEDRDLFEQMAGLTSGQVESDMNAVYKNWIPIENFIIVAFKVMMAANKLNFGIWGGRIQGDSEDEVMKSIEMEFGGNDVYNKVLKPVLFKPEEIKLDHEVSGRSMRSGDVVDGRWENLDSENAGATSKIGEDGTSAIDQDEKSPEEVSSAVALSDQVDFGGEPEKCRLVFPLRSKTSSASETTCKKATSQETGATKDFTGHALETCTKTKKDRSIHSAVNYQSIDLDDGVHNLGGSTKNMNGSREEFDDSPSSEDSCVSLSASSNKGENEYTLYREVDESVCIDLEEQEADPDESSAYWCGDKLTVISQRQDQCEDE
jgi:hypothetical protein